MTATHTAAFHSAIIPNDVLEGRIHAPSFDVQLHLTRWPAPGEGVFKPSMQFIEMQLSPPRVSGTYARGAAPSAYADLADVTFIPQGQPLYCRITPGLQRCISCMFDIGALSQRSAMDWSWPEFDPADALTIRNEYVRIGMRRVAEEVLAPGFAACAQIECLLLFVALELRRHLGSGAESALSAGRLTTRQLALLRNMVVDGPGEIPSIGVLAAACGMGGRQLAASYRKTTGVTLRSFLANASLDRAKNLLLDRSTLIKQVAFDSGFQSSAAFTAAFRKSTGRTPVEYRAAMAAPRLS